MLSNKGEGYQLKLDDKILEMTIRFASCRKCRINPDTFHEGRTVLGEWLPPRGWAGSGAPKVEIFMAALNPGFPLPGERERYNSLGIREDVVRISSEQAKAIHFYSSEQYLMPKRGQNWIFHRKSVALARSLLSMIDGEKAGPEVLRRVWFTDVFKCTTIAETRPKISLGAERACREHLLSEIETLSPRLIVALGRRASDALTRAQIRHVRFRHPSNGCPRLDSEVHDASFLCAANDLGCSIPVDFREIRRKIHEEAFATNDF